MSDVHQDPARPEAEPGGDLESGGGLSHLARSAKFDPAVPTTARMWDRWLGGKDNYPADREAADQLAAADPRIVAGVLASRHFLCRVVRHLADEQGVRQFIDIGPGMPGVDHTHQVAQRIIPDARVVYVDHDPLVMIHARALLTSSTREGIVDHLDADVRDPGLVMDAAAGALDLSEPVALLLLGVLGEVEDHGQALAVTHHLMERVPAGSYLVISDGTNISPRRAEAMRRHNQAGAATYHDRSPQQIKAFFAELELLPPGIVPVNLWRPELMALSGTAGVDMYGGVGLKPPSSES